jgi:hypothetical protein
VRQRTDDAARRCSNAPVRGLLENRMYYGGGILGTILIVVLIVWLVRRI